MCALEDSDSLRTRVSLVDRLRDLDDEASWREFVRRYEQRVMRLARSRGLTTEEAEDVSQEVFRRVAQTICRFTPRERPGSFRSWLFRLTRWRVTDHLRSRASTPSAGAEPRRDDESASPALERVPVAPETEALFEQESRQHLVATLLKRVEKNVSPKHLQIFQLLVLDEVSPVEVAATYGIRVSAVYGIRSRVSARLRDEMRNLQLPLE